MMELLAEMKDQTLIENLPTPKIHCKVFEDNEGAIELAKSPKMRPRTKYLNVKYHHFRDLVTRGIVQIYSITTELQQADILTKMVPMELFEKLRKLMIGW